MGKKSTSYPDIPDEYWTAISKQAEVAERQEEWYENEMYPWLKQVTEESNETYKTLVNASLEDAEWWRDYTQTQTDKSNAIRDQFYQHWQDDYLPIEQSLIEDAQTYNSDAYAEQQAQLAIGDIAASYANQRQQTALDLSKYGVDPTSGQYVGQMNALGVNQAAATAAASNSARQAAVNLGWEKNLALANLGINYANITNSATSALSQTAASSSDATTSSYNTASTNSTAATSSLNQLAQTGLSSYQTLSNAWGQYANSVNSMYSNQISAYSAQQQANASSASGLGSLAGGVVSAAATVGVAI